MRAAVIRRSGADAVVDLADDQAIGAGLGAAAPGGYDVIIDFLRGGPAPQAMNDANVGAGYIQVWSSAGPTSTITAPRRRVSVAVHDSGGGE